MRRLSLIVLLASVVFSSATSFAEDDSSQPRRSRYRESGSLLDASDQHRDMQLAFFVGLPWSYWYGFPIGLGARFYVPIVHNGFIPPVNDEFGIEFGADFWGAIVPSYFYANVDLPVDVKWNFHITDRFAAYAKAGLALQFYINRQGYCGGYGYCGVVGAYPSGALGIEYRVASKLLLRAEAGTWVRIGLGINL